MDESIFVHFVLDDGDPERWIRSIEQFVESSSGDVEWERSANDSRDKLRLRSGGLSFNVDSISGDLHPFDCDETLLRMSRYVDHHFEDGNDGLETFLEFVRVVYEATSPRYGFGMLSYQVDALDVEHPQPISDAVVTERRVDHPTWLTVFSPALVESYGAGWFRDLPVEAVEELSDGGRLVLATSDLLDGMEMYESRQALEAAWD